MTISISVNAGPLLDISARIEAAARVGWQTNRINAGLLAKVRLGFRNSTDPYGQKWEPIQARRRNGRRIPGQPLLDTGRLRNSIRGATTGNSMRIFTDVEYAQYHQLGQRVKKRAFLPDERGLPPDWDAEITKVIRAQLKQILEGFKDD
ncbi:phage virion morphogenesis protein [Pseudomonas sp. URMO17WK12:I11]|uniref:phage virion morphogenesis protein n=1 Tax=Pseudomonas sp. URMO17WK12:I11 TaxID=1283291 RepID=UPI0011AA34BE|nr:phage virion morphogenesis protein [Pseudomonas sp. URMO17WK12:I11]